MNWTPPEQSGHRWALHTSHLNKSEGFDMLFGTCGCLPTASPMSRRGLLCAGGAGFVTALIGTLAGASRTARAQALASRPPEGDSLAGPGVTDNNIPKCIPTTQ